MKKYRYLEWISPGEMHEATLSWISELTFARDEQKFLNSLVQSYTLQLTAAKLFDRSSAIVGDIDHAERELVQLMKDVQTHENQLEIMLDEVDQTELEKKYKETHRQLLDKVNAYLDNYKALKRALFDLVAEVLKKEKQKRLLN